MNSAFLINRPVAALLVLVVYLAACTQSTQNAHESFQNHPGGHEGPSPSSGPPMNPASWHDVPGLILDENDVWGDRVNPRSTFLIPGGMGLMYTSHPGAEKLADPDWREEQLQRREVRAGAAGLAFTSDLLNWRDYPGNPVLNQVVHPWQSPHRSAFRDLLFDPVEERWVAYFSDAGGNYTGIRAVGAAWSYDLVNWEYMDRPLFTVDDYVSAVSERILATEEEIEQHGRVYHQWVAYHEDRFYIILIGTEQVGHTEREGIRSTATGRILLSGNSALGPFEHVPNVPEDELPPGSNKPVWWNGTWYTVFPGNWNGQPGFGLAWSDSLFGTWTLNPMNPVVEVETTRRTHPKLFHFDGTWGILFSDGGYHWESLPLRLAIANIHPALLQTKAPGGQ